MTGSRRLGRRGAFLLILGAGWVVYGAGLAIIPPTDQRGLHVLTRYAPVTDWAWLWIGCGLLALAYAPARRDLLGYLGAIVPPLVWGAANFVAWWPLGAYPRGWTNIAWAAVSAATMLVAGWPEPLREAEQLGGQGDDEQARAARRKGLWP